MRRPDNISHERWVYDAYKALHLNYAPIIYFDTGELICTAQQPHVGTRHIYHDFNIELTTTKSVGCLWLPDGRELKNAWLDDGGQQYLLVDHDTKVAVRLDGGPPRWRGRDGSIVTNNNKKAEYLPGTPERFQFAYGYIGGPGCHPVGNGKVTAWVPHRSAGLTAEQREHIQMIEDTGRAAMKLIDHPAVNRSSGQPSTAINKGCPLDIVLSVTNWQDIPEQHLTQLFQHGVQRMRLTLDWAYTEPR